MNVVWPTNLLIMLAAVVHTVPPKTVLMCTGMFRIVPWVSDMLKTRNHTNGVSREYLNYTL